jgi:hypothetical protein
MEQEGIQSKQQAGGWSGLMKGSGNRNQVRERDLTHDGIKTWLWMAMMGRRYEVTH